VMGQRPTATFSTTALKKILDVCGIDGLSIDPAVDLYFAKTLENGATLAPGLVHTKYHRIQIY
ncbi:MAG: hypothetical protein IIB08_07470, partial [Bacteroidetes bacterium]|nr:hypothetical protein [Bacteroidota bacterium]